MSATVAIVIPTLDRDDLLEPCLEHLQRQTFRNYRVFVLDNGKRSTRPAFLDRFDNLVWIPMGDNVGTAVAFNRGVAEGKAFDYILQLNNDAEVEPECLADLVQKLESDRRYSMAVPKLVRWSDPSYLDGVGDEMLLGGGAYRIGNGERDAGQYERERPVLSACAAAALYRRTLFDEIGGFDEDFFAYYEDVDLSVRAQLFGHRCIYVPKAVARHRGSATSGDTFHPKIMRLTTRNRIFTIVKNYPGSLLFRLAPQVIFFQTLWLAFAIRKRAFLPSCRGFAEAIWGLPQMWRKRVVIQFKAAAGREAFLDTLRESEARIWSWHSSAKEPRPGKLLTTYSRVFGNIRQNRRT